LDRLAAAAFDQAIIPASRLLPDFPNAKDAFTVVAIGEARLPHFVSSDFGSVSASIAE
jgi:hypothetical protein